MPCWPDLWLHLRTLLPLLTTAVAVLLYIALAILLVWAPRLQTRWKVITSRVIGVACLAPLVIASPAILLGLALGNSGPPAQMRAVQSPRGEEARLSYEAGFLGRDYTEVTLKQPACCRHTVVFWHQGPSWFNDPKVEWLDNQHLQISYHSRPDDPQHCEQQLRDITIICKPSPLASGPPAEHDVQPTSTYRP